MAQTNQAVLNKTIPIEIQAELNALANKYAPLFQSSLKTQFEKFAATGDLALSVKIKIIPASDNESPKIILDYYDYGEYVGKARLIFTRQPPVDELVKWVKDKGLNDGAASIPGYAAGSLPGISKEKQDLRIAWAISKKMKFRQRLSRRYRWKKAALPDLLRSLNTELKESWRKETEKILAKAITSKPINP